MAAESSGERGAAEEVALAAEHGVVHVEALDVPTGLKGRMCR